MRERDEKKGGVVNTDWTAVSGSKFEPAARQKMNHESCFVALPMIRIFLVFSMFGHLLLMNIPQCFNSLNVCHQKS